MFSYFKSERFLDRSPVLLGDFLIQMRGSNNFDKLTYMEQVEFRKSLEKKRAYIHFVMIFLGLLIPTLFSVFKKINMNLAFQYLIYAGLVTVICCLYFKAQSLERKLAVIKNPKKSPNLKAS